MEVSGSGDLPPRVQLPACPASTGAVSKGGLFPVAWAGACLPWGPQHRGGCG